MRQRTNGARVERQIGDGVCHRGSGGNHPVLDANMGYTRSVKADQWPIPAPDRPVMEPQMGQLLYRQLHELRQQDSMVVDIRPKTVNDGIDVSAAQGNPFVQLGTTDLNRLFEQRDAGLVPQLRTEQKGEFAAIATIGAEISLAAL